MKVNEELIKKIMETYGGDAQSIADGIEHYKSIEHKIQDCNKSLDTLRKNYEYNHQTIKKEITRIQSECGHLVTSFYGDPSGGNDSFKQCDLCGKEL